MAEEIVIAVAIDDLADLAVHLVHTECALKSAIDSTKALLGDDDCFDGLIKEIEVDAASVLSYPKLKPYAKIIAEATLRRNAARTALTRAEEAAKDIYLTPAQLKYDMLQLFKRQEVAFETERDIWRKANDDLKKEMLDKTYATQQMQRAIDDLKKEMLDKIYDTQQMQRAIQQMQKAEAGRGVDFLVIDDLKKEMKYVVAQLSSLREDLIKMATGGRIIDRHLAALFKLPVGTVMLPKDIKACCMKYVTEKGLLCRTRPTEQAYFDKAMIDITPLPSPGPGLMFPRNSDGGSQSPHDFSYFDTFGFNHLHPRNPGGGDNRDTTYYT